MIGFVLEVLHELGTGFVESFLEAGAIVELKTVETLAK